MRYTMALQLNTRVMCSSTDGSWFAFFCQLCTQKINVCFVLYESILGRSVQNKVSLSKSF